MRAKVLEVKGASYFMYKTNPPILVIAAEGTVPTSGWKSGGLSPWLYIRPPADGIQDFDFTAEAPEGITLEVVSPITADWQGQLPKWMKGFRIHASANNMEFPFGKTKSLKEAQVLRGGDVPWPRATAS